MSILHPHQVPLSGLAGLKQNWRNDALAAFSVSMVALPLSLGIAAAANAPPISGLFSALIAGFVTTWIRGSHIAINGPGNGLIAVILSAMLVLDDGSGLTFRYVLAAVVVSGAIQVLLGLLRLGKLGEFFPSTVLQGILAAIGVIIMGKQLHVALGRSSDAKSTLGVLLELPRSLFGLNPYVALIAVLGLSILVIYPRLNHKFVHFIPAPMWVLMVAIPLAAVLGFSTAHTYSLGGDSYQLGPSLLVQIPDSLLQSVMFPHFGRIGDLPFWGAVFSITVISSIETLISAKAVDTLDPYRRTTDPNRELLGVGVSTLLAGLIGGLPVVTVIARSSVNIHNHAKTRWSNLFTGVFLLVFVVLLAPLIQLVPTAALAAILVHTGFKLTAPKVFKDALKKGWEQLFFLVATFALTLWFGLVWGLLYGTCCTLLFHIVRLGLSPGLFFQTLWNTTFQWSQSSGTAPTKKLVVDGIASFANILKLRSSIDALPSTTHIAIDFSRAELVDLTVLEYIAEVKRRYQHDGRDLVISGLEHHQVSSSYPQALHVMGLPRAINQTEARLSRRQRDLLELAEEQGWSYKRELIWNASYLRNFQFFETRPLEYKENVLSGTYEDLGVRWEIADLTFDEGAVMVDEFHTTVQVLFTEWELPEFVIERIELFDRLMEMVGHEDIDFKFFTTFSHRFVVKGYQLQELERVFTPKMVQFFDSHDVYHLESNGEALLVFRRFRLERTKGILAMHSFSQELLNTIRPIEKEDKGNASALAPNPPMLERMGEVEPGSPEAQTEVSESSGAADAEEPSGSATPTESEGKPS